MSTPTASPKPEPLTFSQARKVAKAHGHHTAPYRGYAHDLHDGTMLQCAPDGKFRIVPLPAITLARQ